MQLCELGPAQELPGKGTVELRQPKQSLRPWHRFLPTWGMSFSNLQKGISVPVAASKVEGLDTRAWDSYAITLY